MLVCARADLDVLGNNYMHIIMLAQLDNCINKNVCVKSLLYKKTLGVKSEAKLEAPLIILMLIDYI